MTVLSRLKRRFGRLSWLDALRKEDPSLAAEVVRVMGGESRADELVEDLHVTAARYLRGSTQDLSEGDLSKRAWRETVDGLPAELVLRDRPAE